MLGPSVVNTVAGIAHVCDIYDATGS